MLSINEIQTFINDDKASEKKRLAKQGVRYYEGEHDIEKCRFFYYDADGNLQEDKYRSNVKISHPFFTELADQLPAYILSFENNPIRASEKAEGLQNYLDIYFDEVFWAEIHELINGAYVKGFDYIYGLVNEDDRLTFEVADGLGVIEVREKYTDDGCKYVIYWYVDRIEKGQKEIIKIQVWSENDVTYYVQEDEGGKIVLDDTVKINPRPHIVFKDENGTQQGYGLGYIPFWRLDNNRKQFSGLKPIKSLIDDYDIHACSLSNNLIDFDTPLYVVSGFQGDNLDELGVNLKTKKMIGTDEGGGVQVQTVSIPYQARQAKLELDEKSIYRFGMGLNTSGLKDTSATTNIGIKSAYSLLDLKATKVKTQLKKLLKSLIKVVLAEINEKHETDYQLSDVYFEFEHNIIVNEAENASLELTKAQTRQVEINTILNVAQSIGDETALKLICEQLDIDFEEVQKSLDAMANAEQEIMQARATLEGAVTDDESEKTAESVTAEGVE